MDSQQFDAITRLAAQAPDRRNMLKMAGAAAVAGTAGLLVRADDAEAALFTVVISNVLNGLTVNIPIQKNNIAVQICAQVEALSAALVDERDRLTCTITQNQKKKKKKN